MIGPAPSARVDTRLVQSLAKFAERPLSALEDDARRRVLADKCAAHGATWPEFVRAARSLWRERDHLVLEGLPGDQPGWLLIASMALSDTARTYREDQIVKRFRMSPWTTQLSHTIRDGHFHTDLNTEPEPPAITAIQCVEPDPDAPSYGCNRVARIGDLLAHLRQIEDTATLRFLCDTDVAMANDRRHDTFRGRIVARERVRYHPETIRTAQRRHNLCADDIEPRLAAVRCAALAVSRPFWLERGDILFVSNHRALHYRGECSVVFEQYPMIFRTREIRVLHLTHEPRPTPDPSSDTSPHGSQNIPISGA